MKLSERTIEILKNFSIITPGLVIKPGNLITAKPLREADSYIYASATIPDTFPKEIAIYDLPKFLGIISSLGDCELKFTENNKAVIQSGSAKVNYTFAEPSLLPQPVKLKLPDSIVKFELSKENLIKLNKISGALGSTHIVIEGNGERLVVKSTQEDAPNSNNYEMEVGPCEVEFKVAFEMKCMIMLSDSYNVQVHKNCVSMTNVASDVTYVMAISNKF